MTTLDLVVRAIDDSIPGVRSLALACADGGVLPSFTPGSHIVVECGSVANAYSLTGDSLQPRQYEISVLEQPDGAGGSRWIHALAVGDAVSVLAPRSAFAPILRASRHLLIAAGIGVTPMVSHLRSARQWGRKVDVMYLHKPGRGAHLGDIEALTDGARIFTQRNDFLATLPTALASAPFGAHLYVCGPSTFIDDVVAAAVEHGWPSSRIHFERFGVGALDPGEPFVVRLANSGSSIEVDSGVSLLQALEAQGYEVPNLCRQGVCGECRLTVSAGDVEHRDMYLTDADKEAGDAIMACVSRAAAGELELKL
ncbi:PDR/VanB family oxidoreductase [Mycobacterium sp. ACS4331]|uniref:PDR/VanB family oxidoreductase n=1 Tax=Mycobacterium sp. ACS4331 TaxID=1834121 RepID=UPI0007FCA7D3|nr:PDR/VanB family oxidoreductase [Mycobacterium sp. ACS4331]OBF23855.1 ferredoxin [Mycobacterium sp. ACS4331]